jgi:hypothetical protein
MSSSSLKCNINYKDIDPVKVKGGLSMAENKDVGFLKNVLIIYAVVSLVYGIGYLFMPDFLVNMS